MIDCYDQDRMEWAGSECRTPKHSRWRLGTMIRVSSCAAFAFLLALPASALASSRNWMSAQGGSVRVDRVLRVSGCSRITQILDSADRFAPFRTREADQSRQFQGSRTAGVNVITHLSVVAHWIQHSMPSGGGTAGLNGSFSTGFFLRSLSGVSAFDSLAGCSTWVPAVNKTS